MCVGLLPSYVSNLCMSVYHTYMKYISTNISLTQQGVCGHVMKDVCLPQVSIVAEERSKYLCWTRPRLRHLLHLRPFLRAIIHNLVGESHHLATPVVATPVVATPHLFHYSYRGTRIHHRCTDLTGVYLQVQPRYTKPYVYHSRYTPGTQTSPGVP